MVRFGLKLDRNSVNWTEMLRYDTRRVHCSQRNRRVHTFSEPVQLNLAFVGEFTPVFAKHTNLSLVDKQAALTALRGSR